MNTVFVCVCVCVYVCARHCLDDSEEAVTYHSLKAQHKKLEHDFITMTKIIGLLSTLTKNYQVRHQSYWSEKKIYQIFNNVCM